MKIYSVSYMATKNDNGHCVSFLSEAEARACLAELLADGVYHARLWS